jgi:hypothetical protein
LTSGDDGVADVELRHGDALLLLHDLEDETVDLVLTDPPYSSGGMFRGDRANQSTTAKYVQTGTIAERRPPGNRRYEARPGFVGGCGVTAPTPQNAAFVRRYHVPRSQVWEGSRGRQRGLVHLHVADWEFHSGRIHRRKGEALCSRKNPWWAREPYPDETEMCPRCEEIASRV